MNLGIFYVEAHAEQGHHGIVKVYMWHACSKLRGKSNLLKNNYFRPTPFPIFVGELGCNVTHHPMHSSRYPPPPRIARICLGTCLILFRNVTWTEPRKTISLLTIERPGTEHCSGALSTELKRDCTINVLPSVTSNPKVLTQLIFFGGFDNDYFLCCCCISGCDGSSDVSVGSCGLYLIRNKCIYCPHNLHEGMVFILSPLSCSLWIYRAKNPLSGTVVTYLGYLETAHLPLP